MAAENSNKWFYAFLPLAWAGHIGLGLALGIDHIMRYFHISG
jgi:hypothetical protein